MSNRRTRLIDLITIKTWFYRVIFGTALKPATTQQIEHFPLCHASQPEAFFMYSNLTILPSPPKYSGFSPCANSSKRRAIFATDSRYLAYLSCLMNTSPVFVTAQCKWSTHASCDKPKFSLAGTAISSSLGFGKCKFFIKAMKSVRLQPASRALCVFSQPMVETERPL